MPEVGAEEEEEPGVLSPPRPPQLLPNLGCPALIGPTLSVWEELPQGCLRKPGRGGLQVQGRRCTLPVTEKLGPRQGARSGDPGAGDVGLVQHGPGSRFAVCPRGVAPPLCASAWRALTESRPKNSLSSAAQQAPFRGSGWWGAQTGALIHSASCLLRQQGGRLREPARQ